MKLKVSVVRGLAYDIIIEELDERDERGAILFYVASIYWRSQITASKNLIRRSRLPGIGAIIIRELQHDGIRALRRYRCV